MMKLAILAFFASMTIGFALVVVLSKKVFRAAFGLMGTLCGVAGLMSLYGNVTLAALQVLIYVGGIFVLFLFSILVTENIEKAAFRSRRAPLAAAGAFAGGIMAYVIAAVASPYFRDAAAWSLSAAAISAKEIGASFLSVNVVSFEAVSVLLLAALVGAVVVIRKELAR